MKGQFLEVSLVDMNGENVEKKVTGNYAITNNKIPKELVSSFVTGSTYYSKKVFGKLTTILEYELRNGFTGVESVSCVDEKNYNFEIGKEILRKRLEDKIWFGLGFALGMAKEI